MNDRVLSGRRTEDVHVDQQVLIEAVDGVVQRGGVSANFDAAPSKSWFQQTKADPDTSRQVLSQPFLLCTPRHCGRLGVSEQETDLHAVLGFRDKALHQVGLAVQKEQARINQDIEAVMGTLNQLLPV